MIQLALQLALLVIISISAVPVAQHALDAMSAPNVTAPPPIAVPREPSQNPVVSTTHEVPFQPLAAYPLTTSRPLFFEGRAYPKRESKSQPELSARQNAPLPSFKLHGVLIGRGFKRALIAAGTQPPNWISIGEGGQGWSLEAIDGNAVRLKLAGRLITLELY